MKHISKEDRETYTKTILIVGSVLLIFLAWLWWSRIYSSKSNVFNAMLSNNLSTRGVTKTTQQDNSNGKLTQTSQAQFGAQYLVETKTDITQPSEGGDIKVSTQSFSTPNEDYVRYTSIDMPQVKNQPKKDFSSLVSIWGKTLKAEGGGGAFTESTYGVISFGNLPSEQRNELLNIIHSQGVYKTDFSKTEIKKESGRTVYIYDVSINLKGYATFLKAYDKMLGLKQMDSINPDDYEKSKPINVKLTVDKLSRTLTKIDYQDQNSDETIAGYGIAKNVKLPENAISRQELEGKLQKLLQENM